MEITEKILTVTSKVIEGKGITFEEAMSLINIDVNDSSNMELLLQGADRIRSKYNGDQVELCTIMNARSGNCTEDCKFCAQSVHYRTEVDVYGLINYEKVLARVREIEQSGAHRFSLVTSGKKLNSEEFKKVVEIYRRLARETDLRLCASLGLLEYEQALELKSAGVSMYHHNLETSKDYFSKICTTHTYEERVETVQNAIRAGLEVCCGGIIGLGESNEDRVKMAFAIKELKVSSIPVNILNPISNTPLAGKELPTPDEILKVLAIYRYIIPAGSIRYAGGRSALGDKQRLGFRAGVNAALTGNYLTTTGSNLETDIEMIISQGLKI